MSESRRLLPDNDLFLLQASAVASVVTPVATDTPAGPDRRYVMRPVLRGSIPNDGDPMDVPPFLRRGHPDCVVRT